MRRLAGRTRALDKGTGTPASIVPATEVLLYDRSDSAATFPELPGLQVHRVSASPAFRSALRGVRRAVIAMAAPPATIEDLEMVAEVRAQDAGLRALLVNEAGDVGLRLDALALGFDDAVPVTVGAKEIRGRIAVLVKRARAGSLDRLPIGTGMELDLVARAFRRHGRLVHLRPMEFRLLEELARNPGRPITREWLLWRVWGTHELDGSRTVDVHIRWLRAKVERDPEHPEHLLTVRGVGYQLELGRDGAAPG